MTRCQAWESFTRPPANRKHINIVAYKANFHAKKTGESLSLEENKIEIFQCKGVKIV